MTQNNDALAALTRFSAVAPARLVAKVDQVIQGNQHKLNRLLANYKKAPRQLNWGNSFQLLDDWDERLMENLFMPADHLKSVCETPQLRTAYTRVLPKITAYQTDLCQNQSLYALAQDLRGAADLTEAQSSALDDYLFTARLLGVGLPAKERRAWRRINARLTRQSNRFGENVLDATMAWSQQVKDEETLQGMPPAIKEQLKQNARALNKAGYVVNLQEPCYRGVIQFAANAKLRKEIYRAYGTRASELGEHRAKYDNTQIMADILECRCQKANLLGFKTSAHMLMARNMVTAPATILAFINDLARRALPSAQQEAKELKEFGLKRGGKPIQPWDLAFYAEQLRNEEFAFSSEELRAYFPLPKILKGMFALVERIFDIRLKAEKEFDPWHPDVCLFAVRRGSERLGFLYCDLYARAHKRGGAWMNENRRRRRRKDGSVQLPVAYLICNFRPPIDGVSLLDHTEVLTLLHELGHCLHHLLTRVDCRAVSGIAGVPHDMVELPSQLIENWCWDGNFIKTISSHYKTGAPLPASKLRGLTAARNFNSALALMRQLEFALFDLCAHTELDEKILKADPRAILRLHQRISARFNPLPRASFVRFPHAFTHIFAGGYAAGYYAYKWSEVMSADIYAAFQRTNLDDREVARRVRRHIFERGGVGDALQNFKAVLGREPRSEAFLKSYGLA